MAASALRTSSTDGNPRNRRSASAVIAASSVTEQEGVNGAAPIAQVAQQQVQRQRRNVVGNRIQRGILLLLEDFYVAAAGVAGLRSNKTIALGAQFVRLTEFRDHNATLELY